MPFLGRFFSDAIGLNNSLETWKVQYVAKINVVKNPKTICTSFFVIVPSIFHCIGQCQLFKAHNSTIEWML